MLYNARIPPNHVRVTIDIDIKDDALLPIPLDEDIITLGGAICTSVAWPVHLVDVIPTKYQSSDPRLSARFSPERERITWEGEILDYTGRFSPKREFPRLGEKWQTGVVDTVRFSLKREGTC
ncbi:hypothetical protein Lal_00043223 [Lupinus albus]|nr:hypothetical protein Lal_00043223 [Lupinus albus]